MYYGPVSRDYYERKVDRFCEIYQSLSRVKNYNDFTNAIRWIDVKFSTSSCVWSSSIQPSFHLYTDTLVVYFSLQNYNFCAIKQHLTTKLF